MDFSDHQYDRDDDAWKGEHLLVVPRPKTGWGGNRGGGSYAIQKRKPRHTERREQIQKMILSGMEVREIAEALGVTTSIVRQDASILGLSTRRVMVK